MTASAVPAPTVPAPAVPAPAVPAGRGAPALLRRVWFWIRRYGIAELAGTAAILLAALPLEASGAPVPLVAVVAVVAENVGFYGVMAIAVLRELRRTAPAAPRGRLVRRALGLLVAEFGPAELLDSLLVRPALVALSLVLVGEAAQLGGAAALFVGKIAADLVFYGLAAVSFTLTRRLGWRSARGHD